MSIQPNTLFAGNLVRAEVGIQDAKSLAIIIPRGMLGIVERVYDEPHPGVLIRFENNEGVHYSDDQLTELSLVQETPR